MNDYKEIISKCKEGDEKSFLILAENFEPLIKKYVRLLYKDEAEDIKQEMLFALWVAVNKIEFIVNEGQCTNYFANALKRRFLELYRRSKRFNEYICLEGFNYYEENNADTHDYINDINIKNDIDKFLDKYCPKTRELCKHMLFDRMSDSQISEKFDVSRQYVNRIRRRLRLDLYDYFYGG